MKPKLLITLGCSVTQGYGSWDYTIVPDNKRIWDYDFPQLREFEELHEDIFLKNSWPYKLQRLNGYDKLINFGINGSSVSHQLKAFVERLIDEYFTEYEVTLIWLATFSDRISFYNGGKLQSYNSYSQENLYKEFINEIQWVETDVMLEMISCVKIIKEFCKSRNWNFIFGNLDLSADKFIEQYYPNVLNDNIHIPNMGSVLLDMIIQNTNTQSKICNHPNEFGYEKMADVIYSWISENKPNLINTIPLYEYESVAYKHTQYERFNGNIRSDIRDKLKKEIF